MSKNNHDEKKIISPIHSTPNGVTSPIYFLDDNINTENRFIITRFTDGGKYVRGNMIFYTMKGVEIYAELEDAIYVDLINHTAVVKKFKEIEDETTKVDPEERQYILMLVPYGYEECDNDTSCKWVAMQGRTSTYEYIRDHIESYEFDPARSLVLTQNIKFKDAFTIVQFVDFIKNSDMVAEDDFDIHYYTDELEDGEENG